MKTVLIITAHFPPVDVPDIHRIRQSVNYYKRYGWNPVIVAVNPRYVQDPKNELLSLTVPADLPIHWVKALNYKWTKKFGLGDTGIRSLIYFKAFIRRYLKTNSVDLLFFSTTRFPLLILGNYFKRKFGIPYVIDMQDPWVTNYYDDKPRSQRPSKYWLSKNLSKRLEPIAMKRVDGIMSVSQDYIDDLANRYERIKNIPCTTITFGWFEKDIELVSQGNIANEIFNKSDQFIHWVYAGIVGPYMQYALELLFSAFRNSLDADPAKFENIRLYFIGTSYAPGSSGENSVLPLAKKFGLEKYITERPQRLPYFSALKLLKDADGLIVPGSDDPHYSASKIFNYILAKKPLLTIFHENSNVNRVLEVAKIGHIIKFNKAASEKENLVKKVVSSFYKMLAEVGSEISFEEKGFAPFSAKELTRKQAEFFELVLSKVQNDN